MLWARNGWEVLKGCTRGLGAALCFTFKHPDTLSVNHWSAQTRVCPGLCLVKIRLEDWVAHGNTWTDHHRKQSDQQLPPHPPPHVPTISRETVMHPLFRNYWIIWGLAQVLGKPVVSFFSFFLSFLHQFVSVRAIRVTRMFTMCYDGAWSKVLLKCSFILFLSCFSFVL